MHVLQESLGPDRRSGAVGSGVQLGSLSQAQLVIMVKAA
jgi:hypothetical protein